MYIKTEVLHECNKCIVGLKLLNTKQNYTGKRKMDMTSESGVSAAKLDHL